jgi:AraC-like DNA-binding protein
MSDGRNLLSLVPAGARHDVQGQRVVALPGAVVDVLTARKIVLKRWELFRLSDPHWRLYWPLEPGGVVEIDGEETALLPGRIYLIPPHTPFSSRTVAPFSKWYVHFNLGPSADRAQPGIYGLTVEENDRRCLEAVAAFASRSGAAPAGFCWAAVGLVAGALERLPAQVWQHHRLDERVRTALDFMSAHLALKLSADQIARFAGLSVRNLNHLFQQCLGRSPMRVLLDFRLDQACGLLRHGTASIDEIAEQCGLVNRHYLSRMMRQYRNTSPAAYRREAVT